jgi:asparagine synthase (glutamine-hydrolysing)
MCGINAIFAYGRNAAPVSEQELLAVRDRMMKRGPDGAGAWIDPERRVGLAHRRLAIIDLSEAGAQPMAAGGEGEPVITYNGEIYNFRSLRDGLERDGYSFRTECDTEVILRLYQRDGMDAFAQMRGMFALAIWDPAQRRMVLARDPFGIKPLYIADNGNTLRIASSARALAGLEAVNSSISASGAAGFHMLGSVPDPFTIWEGVTALEAGTAVAIDADGMGRPHRFFSLGREIAGDGAGETDLATAMRDSIDAHLVADVPVGLFLSAGLDSTTIAALTAEVSRTAPKAITLGFEEFTDSPNDEVPLATRAAELYGCDHDIQRVSAAEFADNAETILGDMDQPTIDGVNVWFVSRAARRSGLKVALSGLGGDELFCGYDSFTDVPRIMNLARLALGSRSLGKMARKILSALPSGGRSPKLAGLFEYGGSTGGAWLLRRALRMPWELGEVMDADMAAEGLRRLDIESRLAASVSGIDDPTGRVQALEAGWYMQNQLLRDADWAGMAHSLEIRVPLVDPVLFRAVRRMAATGNRPGKRDMALTARPQLPPEILDRRKTGFFVPVADWVQGGSESRGYRGWASHIAGNFGF